MKSNSDADRRKLLVGLTGGIAGISQIPAQWSKPIVDTVLLPAHAQTSTTTVAPTTAAPATTPAPVTTPAPTTPAPCPTPVLDANNVTTSTNLVLTDPSGQTSGGMAKTQITNTSTVAISLSNSLSVVPSVQGVNFNLAVPSQLQPGQSGAITIDTIDNLCQVQSVITLQITATSLDPVCQGSVILNLNVDYIPNC